MTLEEIAATLCNGQPPEWAIDRLQRYSLAVRHHTKDYDDKWDRLAFEAGLNLQIWLMMEARACDALDEDCPVEIDDADIALAELLPLIASYIRQPGKRAGPTVDGRRHVCGAVCASIWQEFHPTAGSNSDILLAACEAYWQACGQPPTAADLSGNLRNWKWFLPTSNSPKKSEVR